MLTEIVNKILFLALFMAITNVLRHLFFLTQAIIKSTNDEPRKYKLSNISLLLLNISLGYILTCVFSGIKI